MALVPRISCGYHRDGILCWGWKTSWKWRSGGGAHWNSFSQWEVRKWSPNPPRFLPCSFTLASAKKTAKRENSSSNQSFSPLRTMLPIISRLFLSRIHSLKSNRHQKQFPINVLLANERSPTMRFHRAWGLHVGDTPTLWALVTRIRKRIYRIPWNLLRGEQRHRICGDLKDFWKNYNTLRTSP